MPDKHAILSPSACSRWSNCTAAPRLEARFPESTSEYAEQGTAAHSMGEKKVKTLIHERCVRSPTEYDDDEMDEMTDIYRDVCAGQLAEAKKIEKEPMVMAEQMVDLRRIVPEGFGTADFLILTPEKIWVTDLKYGTGVKVSAKENPQLKLYGAGAFYNFEFLYPDVKKVCLTIVQPRLNCVESWEVGIDELMDWAENYIAPKARIAYEGGPEAEQKPGEWCRFCRAKSLCRACAQEALDLLQPPTAEETDETEETSQGAHNVYQLKSPQLIDHETLEDIMPSLNRISSWINSVFSYAQSEALKGVKFKGYKLVEGQSRRVYKDEDEVIKACVKNGYTDIYNHKLIGITDMKKLLKDDFDRIMDGLIVKPPGKLSLVEESDKRKEVQPDAVANSAEESLDKISTSYAEEMSALYQ